MKEAAIMLGYSLAGVLCGMGVATFIWLVAHAGEFDHDQDLDGGGW